MMKKTSENNSTRQALVAKLMATENIDVRFEKVETAAFDLENRQLILPIYENLTDSVYSMMIAHEVSHALNTPLEDWNTAVGKDSRKKAYLNIIEDARIERLIKRRYPGVIHDFKAAYAELHERDFFGLRKNNADVASLPLIDRINLHFKSYGALTVPFAAEEMEWVRRVEAAASFDDVVKIAEELIDSYSESEPEPTGGDDGDDSEESESGSESGEGSSTESGDETGESDSNDSDSDSDADGDAEGDSDDSSTESENGSTGRSKTSDSDTEGDTDTESGSDSDEGDNDSNDSASDGIDDSDYDDIDDNDSDDVGDGPASGERGSMSTPNDPSGEAPDSTTQESFDENMSNNAEKNGYYRDHLGTAYISDPVLDEHWESYVDDVNVFLKIERDKFNSYAPYNYALGKNVPYTDADMVLYYKALNKKNGKVINHMIKEFDLKKSAAEHRRTMTAKTGNLDTDRLYNYKVSDDIFLSHEITPDGKNHGVIILIDFSGSMNSNNRIGNTLNQVFNFAAFCKKVGIPYRVFGFTNSTFTGEADADRNELRKATHDLFGNGVDKNSMYYNYGADFRLIEIINSSMRKNDWIVAMGLIAGASGALRNESVHGAADGRYVYSFTSGWLGGTPLNGALYIAPYVVRDFVRKNRVDRSIFMLFTDGAAGDGFCVNTEMVEDSWGSERARREDVRYAKVYYDPKTKDYLRVANHHHFNDALSNFLTRRVRLLSGAKVMGYDIRPANKRGAGDIAQNVARMNPDDQAHNDYYYRWNSHPIAKDYRENGFYHVTDIYGFESFTFISEAAKVEDATIESEIRNGDVENASRKAIENAFIRANKKTNDSRFLVKKLMEVIG